MSQISTFVVAPDAVARPDGLGLSSVGTGITFQNGASTITRQAGSWATDQIVAGSKFRISGDTVVAANNGVYTVTSITSATVLVITPAPTDEATVNLALTFTEIVSKDTTGIAADKFAVLPVTSVTWGAGGGSVAVPFLPGEKLVSATPIASRGNITITASTKTIGAAAGSILTAGATVGSQIVLYGSTSSANDGLYQIATIASGTSFTVIPLSGQTMVDQGTPAATGVALVKSSARVSGAADINGATGSIAGNVRLKAVKGYALNTAFASSDIVLGTKSLSWGTAGTVVLNSAYRQRQDPAAPFMTGTGTTVTTSTGTAGLVRQAGSWYTDGIAAGSQIQIIGAVQAATNGLYNVVSITNATTLVMDRTVAVGEAITKVDYVAGVKKHRYEMQVPYVG